ncbi:ABC transporter substrate-binding protein, partial [bacterium]|nr:ABC transporter substrate-binding protein [bacterium]
YGITPAVLNPLDYGIDFYGDTLFTSEAYLKAKPDVVARFRRASLKGWQYAMKHHQEIADVIVAQPTLRLTKPDHHSLMDEANAIDSIVLPKLVEMGNMNPGRWEEMAKIYQDFGMVSSLSPLEGFTYEVNAGNQEIRKYSKIFGVVLAGIALLTLLGFFALRQLKSQVKLRTLQLTNEIAEREITEKKLVESESLLHQCLQAIPDLVWLKDMNGVYLSCNQRFERFFGARECDIVGKTDYDF